MHNAAAVIGEQLEALTRQDYAGAWEVIVADNGSTDGGSNVVRAFAGRLPGLSVVDASDRQGASHARNVGTALARGDFVVYADADDVVTSGWLAAMAHAACEADFVAGRQDEEALSAGRSDAPADTSKRWKSLPRSPGFLPWAFGGNCGVSRRAFAEVGGWRDDYPHGGDDVDFCWRVQLAGYPLQYVPDAVVQYRPRPTLRGHVRQQFEFGSRAPRLYREFREHGARRSPARRVLRHWAWIATRSPYLFMSARRRRSWIAAAAGATGRLWGSIRWKAFYP